MNAVPTARLLTMKQSFRSKPVLAATLTIMLACVAPAPEAQQTAEGPTDAARSLVGTWTLAAVEREGASGEFIRIPGSQGLLVVDSVGHVFEFFGAASAERRESPRLDPQRTFADFGGFWGRYEIAAADRIDFEAAAGVSPSLRGLAFSRSFETSGDRLVMISASEPQAQADTRWTWQRVPTLESLSPAYRRLVGFWQHVEERRVNVTTGEMESVRHRDPSVIVYTPAGYFGVHFPALDREPFAGDTPTLEEAQAAARSYIGYFGALGVYPGEVAHNVLAGVAPSAGAILRRFAEITGDEAVLTLPSAARTADAGPRFVTTVHMRRLSGIEELLPR